ncbi:hypothetical protein E4U21_005185 [Claviceps maximensis]|nr:hypothetical protein E4U21_005185 [Claviceps maximensis]
MDRPDETCSSFVNVSAWSDLQQAASSQNSTSGSNRMDTGGRQVMTRHTLREGQLRPHLEHSTNPQPPMNVTRVWPGLASGQTGIIEQSSDPDNRDSMWPARHGEKRQ